MGNSSRGLIPIRSTADDDGGAATSPSLAVGESKCEDPLIAVEAEDFCDTIRGPLEILFLTLSTIAVTAVVICWGDMFELAKPNALARAMVVSSSSMPPLVVS